VVAVVLAGCGRFGFDAQPKDAPNRDAPIDTAMIDTAIDGSTPPTDCWATWHTGAPQLGAPIKLTMVDTQTRDERKPSFSDDGLTLYYTSGPAGSDRADEMLYAIRTAPGAAPGAAWTPGGSIASFASPAVSKLAVADADLQAVISAAYGSDQHNVHLWTAERATPALSWPVPTRVGTSALDGSDRQLDPVMSGDGLVLYYSELAESLTSQVIRRSARSSVAAAFTAPSTVITGSTDSVGDPAFSPDELVLLYTERSAQTIAIATRQAVSDPFARIGLLAALTTGNAHDAAFSRDGCELVFSSTRDGTYDLYVVVATSSGVD
jgi:Tol biopolymer transport system component